MKQAVKFLSTRLQACVVLRVGYHETNFAYSREFGAWRAAYACKSPDLYSLGRCLAMVPFTYPINSETQYNLAREDYHVNLRMPAGQYPLDGHWVEAQSYRVGYVAAAMRITVNEVWSRLNRSTEWLPVTSVFSEFGEMPALNEDANLWYNITERLTSGSKNFDEKTLAIIEERATRVRSERRNYLKESARKF